MTAGLRLSFPAALSLGMCCTTDGCDLCGTSSWPGSPALRGASLDCTWHP